MSIASTPDLLAVLSRKGLRVLRALGLLPGPHAVPAQDTGRRYLIVCLPGRDSVPKKGAAPQ